MATNHQQFRPEYLVPFGYSDIKSYTVGWMDTALAHCLNIQFEGAAAQITNYATVSLTGTPPDQRVIMTATGLPSGTTDYKAIAVEGNQGVVVNADPYKTRMLRYVNGQSIFGLTDLWDAPIEMDSGKDYHVGLRANDYPVESRLSDSGAYQYTRFAEGIGEVGDPNTVTDNGNSTITFRVNTVCGGYAWPNTSTTSKRHVSIWLDTPLTSQSRTEAQTIATSTGTGNAIFHGTVDADGSNIEVTVPHTMGQTTISTTAAHYKVMCHGFTVTDKAVLNMTTYTETLSGVAVKPYVVVAEVDGATGTISYASAALLTQPNMATVSLNFAQLAKDIYFNTTATLDNDGNPNLPEPLIKLVWRLFSSWKVQNQRGPDKPGSYLGSSDEQRLWNASLAVVISDAATNRLTVTGLTEPNWTIAQTQTSKASNWICSKIVSSTGAYVGSGGSPYSGLGTLATVLNPAAIDDFNAPSFGYETFADTNGVKFNWAAFQHIVTAPGWHYIVAVCEPAFPDSAVLATYEATPRVTVRLHVIPASVYGWSNGATGTYKEVLEDGFFPVGCFNVVSVSPVVLDSFAANTQIARVEQFRGVNRHLSTGSGYFADGTAATMGDVFRYPAIGKDKSRALETIGEVANRPVWATYIQPNSTVSGFTLTTAMTETNTYLYKYEGYSTPTLFGRASEIHNVEWASGSHGSTTADDEGVSLKLGMDTEDFQITALRHAVDGDKLYIHRDVNHAYLHINQRGGGAVDTVDGMRPRVEVPDLHFIGDTDGGTNLGKIHYEPVPLTTGVAGYYGSGSAIPARFHEIPITGDYIGWAWNDGYANVNNVDNYVLFPLPYQAGNALMYDATYNPNFGHWRFKGFYANIRFTTTTTIADSQVRFCLIKQHLSLDHTANNGFDWDQTGGTDVGNLECIPLVTYTGASTSTHGQQLSSAFNEGVVFIYAGAGPGAEPSAPTGVIATNDPQIWYLRVDDVSTNGGGTNSAIYLTALSIAWGRDQI